MKEKEIEKAFARFIDGRETMTIGGQQVHLPMGILDLLMVLETESELVSVVVEVKRGTIDEKAVTQCLGYMAQVELLLNFNCQVMDSNFNQAKVRGWLVGANISKMAWRVVKAAGMAFWQYYQDSSGEIQFEEPDWHDTQIMECAAEPELLEIARRMDAKNIQNRRINAAWVGLSENFEAALEGRNVRYEKLSSTVAYWSRPVKRDRE